MEIILLIVVIIFLIVQNSKISNNSKGLSREINILNEKLNGLHSLLTSKQTTKTIEKESVRDVIKKTIVTPPEPAPVVPIKTPPTIIQEVEEDYIVSYPNVIKLSDKDISIIKKIFKSKCP